MLRIGTNNAGGDFISARNFGVRDDVLMGLNKNILGNASYTVMPYLLRPKSRGYLKLRDVDPDQHPIIVPNFFDDPHDLDVLVSCSFPARRHSAL